MITPEKLSKELGVSGKTIRHWLLDENILKHHQKYGRFFLTEKQEAKVREKFFKPFNRAKSREKMVVTTIALDKGTHRRVVNLAKTMRMSFAELIREILSGLGR